MTSPKARCAVFLDRDGTLNVERASYVRTVEELEMLPGAARALKPLAQRKVPLVIISNQAGVGKGLMAEADLQAIEAAVRKELAAEGVHLTAAYYCRHTDEMACECRKPKPGLITAAARELNIDVDCSFMVGDNWRDMAAGRGAGARTVFLPTGLHPKEQRERTADMADYFAEDLTDAVRWICEQMDQDESS
ncbi:MAG: HAD family hydrolase [Armatimonadetes bacterium]|nr:HAD family hydrolase [Armatimonadota bacterium]